MRYVYAYIPLESNPNAKSLVLGFDSYPSELPAIPGYRNSGQIEEFQIVQDLFKPGTPVEKVNNDREIFFSMRGLFHLVESELESPCLNIECPIHKLHDSFNWLREPMLWAFTDSDFKFSEHPSWRAVIDDYSYIKNKATPVGLENNSEPGN